jgi:hypothetical protein
MRGREWVTGAEISQGAESVTTILAAIATLGLSLAAAITCFLIVDRFVSLEWRRGHNDLAGFVFAVVGPMYAILLAFVVFVVWGYYQDAKSAGSNVAVSLYAIWGVSNGFDGQEGVEIRQAAIAYAESVIHDDWPALARGKQSPRTTAAIGALRGRIQAFNPVSNRDNDLYQSALSDMHDLTVARASRTLKGAQTVHPVLWVGLIVGAVISSGFSYLFGIRDSLGHALMTGVLTISIVGILFIIKTIDGPYRGDVSVRPDAMQQTLDMMRAGAIAGRATR